MARIESTHFGTVEYSEDAVVEFPDGLPAFESERRFVLIERPESAPVLFLQSMTRRELCFLTLPVAVLDADYPLQGSPEEFADLGFQQPPSAADPDLLLLAILTVPANGTPTANLMAPVVIHRRNRRARQIVQLGSTYSFEHPLLVAQEETC